MLPKRVSNVNLQGLVSHCISEKDVIASSLWTWRAWPVNTTFQETLSCRWVNAVFFADQISSNSKQNQHNFRTKSRTNCRPTQAQIPDQFNYRLPTKSAQILNQFKHKLQTKTKTRKQRGEDENEEERNKEEGLLDSRSNATRDFDFPALKGFSSTKGNKKVMKERRWDY